MRKLIIFIILFFLFSASLYSSDKELDSLWSLGNQSYDKNDFSTAIEYYNQILSKGIKNSQVYYNLGNAYFRNQNLGKAILSYRRAEVLDPQDEDIKANLSFAKRFTLDKLENPPIDFFSNIFNSILNFWNMNTLTLLTFLFYLIFMGLSILLLFYFKLRRFLKAILFISLMVFLILGITLGAKIYKYSTTQNGVIVTPEVKVYSGPGEDFTLQFTGHEGLEFKVQEEKGEWYLILLSNGVRGWIPKEACERI